MARRPPFPHDLRPKARPPACPLPHLRSPWCWLRALAGVLRLHARTSASQARACPQASPLHQGQTLLALLAPALLLSLLLLALSSGQTARAQSGAVLYVSTTGSPTGDCQRRLVTPTTGSPYYQYDACTVARALAVAMPGDTLRFERGDYPVSIELTRSLTLVGGYPIGFVNPPSQAEPQAAPATNPTRIIGLSGQPAIILRGPVTTTTTLTYRLDGLRILHNGLAQGRGISVTVSADALPAGVQFPVVINIVQSWIQGNFSSGDGGGIGVHPRIAATVGITNTEISGNRAAKGGGIHLPAGSSLVSSNSRFLNNTATTDGGALYLTGVISASLSGETFSGNRATSGNGGAIYANGSPLALAGSLTGNMAGANGGALFLSGSPAANATLSGVTLANNTASAGGGIYATNINLSFASGSANDNQATAGSGGGLYLRGGTVTLTGLTWRNNQAGSDGGAAYLNANSVAVTNSPFIHNNHAQRGGALYIEASSATVNDNTLLTNTANIDGGALYLTGATTGTLKNNILSGNRAVGGGGGLYMLNNGAISGGPLTFSNNEAQQGGGLYAANSRLNAGGALTFTENRAGSGGGVYLATSAALTATAASFLDNAAQQHGGGLYASDSAVDFGGTTVINSNTAVSGDGGGLYLTGGSAGTFALLQLGGNVAGGSGGGLYADGVTLAFGSDSSIADNIATTGSGGGVYSMDSGLTFAKVTLARNHANVDGGGLYAPGSNVALGNASLVTLNQAQTGNGGGLYIGGGTATLTGITLHQNFAHIHGGGLYVTGAAGTSLLVAGGSQVTSNLAGSGQGGGLFVAGGAASDAQVTIQASRLANNQAETGGGALYQTGGSLVVTDTTQIAANNTVTGGGGGLAVISGTVTVANSTVEGNTGFTDGGGLYAPGGTVRIAGGASFTGNSVTLGKGGAIYADGLHIEVDGATLADNTAAAGGGGIYAATHYAGVANSEILHNNAGAGSGGGAFFRADLVSLTGNTVEGNETAGNGAGFAFEQTPKGFITANRISGNTVRQDVTETTAILQQDVRHPATGQIISVNGVPQVAGTEVISRSVSEGNGGGLHFVSSSAVLTGNIVLGNSNAAGEGGGFYVTGSAITLTNNVIAQNSVAISDTFGAGFYIVSSQVKLVHTTIADNRNTSPDADALGVGLYVTKGATETSSINMVNNIVAGHELGMMLLTGSRAAMSSTLWSNTGGDWDGPGLYEPVQGNFRGDPRFIDRNNGDYRIARDSAAFDIGVASGVATDIEGVRRPRAFSADAGAYEHFYPQGVHIKATATPRFVGSGETISYQVQIVNHSPVDLHDVTVSFILPGQQSATSISGGPCAGTSCTFGALAVDQSATINLQATATGTPPDGGFIEMETTINVSSPSFGASDTQQKVITRLQRCRIHYQGTDYPSLQSAVNAVNDFDDTPDTIRVAGYCGGGVIINKKLTLQGGWNFALNTLNPSAFPTTLDSAGTGRVMEIRGDIAPTVENLILRNGTAAGTSDGPSGKAAGGVLFIKDATATLKNIRVTGGSSPDYGGGIFVDKLTTPTIRDSVIEANSAGEGGGGLYANNSSPELINVTIRNNSAQAGGGLYLRKSEAKVINSTISNNQATGTARYLEVAGFNVRLSVGGGGGVNFDESKASITGSTLENNTAKAGGALFADNSPGSISTSIIRNNQATGSATIIPVIVLANTAGGGGAIYAQRSDLTIEHNQITHNSSAGDGGAIHIFNGSADAKINGNFFGFNQAGKGSAIYVHLKPDTFKIFVFPFTIPDFLMPILLGQPQPDPPKLVLQHNTFAHNGGSSVVHLYGESYAELVANIFAFNSGTGVQAETAVLPYVMMIPVPIIVVIPIPFPVFYVPKADLNYTLWYQNGSNTGTSGVGASAPTANDLTGDPAFKDDGFHIKRISAAYNTGKNTGISVDIDGQPRPQADRAEMGADEYPAIGVRYVAPGGSDDGSNLCRDYLNPCGTLQDAIDAAREGDLIKMAGGVYTVHDTRQGQVQLGFITKTVTIQGGYYRFTTDNDVTDGLYTDHDWEDPHPDVNPTILDAGNQGRVFYILDEKRVDEDGNPIEVKPVLSGLQLKNGNATGLRGPEGNLFDAGGAIYVDHAAAVITDVIVSDSIADYGGAIYMISSTLTLGDVMIRNNQANERGGGFYLDQSDDVTIANIVIEGNKAPHGAGLYLERSAATLRLNRIIANGDSSATLAGGGLYLDASDATVVSNTITANIAGNGAGIFVTAGKAQIQGNSVTGNWALLNQPGFGRGGGFYLETGPARITLNLVQSNQALVGGGFFMDEADASVEDNQVVENVANHAGGGFYLLNTSAGLVRRNTVSANLANGTGENDGGGGFYLESSNATLAENTVTHNQADDGGGAYLFSFSNASIQKNVFRQNSAVNDGGGLYLKLSNAGLEENTITENTTAQGSGGGAYVKLSGARFTKNTIDANVAALNGGGLYLDESGAILQEDTARTNRATDGGGIYIYRSNTASFDKVDIRNNQANRNGGGLYIRLSNIPLADHQIVDNQAGSGGGGIYLDESAASLSRNVLRGNRAGERGGGLAAVRRSHASLASNALVDNQAGATGSGVYVAGSNPRLVHSTIARNSGGDGTGVAAEKLDNAPSTVTLINTILAGQALAVHASQGNTITLEATLWDSNQRNWVPGAGAIVTGTAGLNFFGQANFQPDGIHINKDSKAVGVGIASDAGRDIDGDGRPQGSGPELGADELLADCAAVASSNTGIVYNKVQLAIDAAQPGDEVRISGTCVGAEARANLVQLAYINKDITVRGGYTPTNWTVSYPLTQPTFLDAMGLGRVIYVAAGFNPVIEHLNLANGDAKGMGGGPGGLDAGGVIYIRNANPTLRHLTVSGGNAYYGGGVFLQATSAGLTASTLESNKGIKGGAIFLRNSTALLRDNILRNNQADDGGGLFLSFSQPVVERNQIAQNVVVAAGGGLFLESSAATLRENQVTTNTAQAAGGIYVDGATPQLIRNRISANTGQNAGGLYLSGSNALVDGNMLLANSAGIGGGLYIQGGTPELLNNVIAKNGGQVQAAALYALSASPRLRHNTLAANTGGDGSGLFVTDLGVSPSNLTLINNILVGHSTAISVTLGNRVTLQANLLYNNQREWGGAGIVEEQAGNVRADPSFVNPDQDDYHLRNNSPARDLGVDAGITEDFDGHVRPADDGFDIGADEFVFLGLAISLQTVPDPVVAGAPFQFLVRAINQGNVDVDATIVAQLPPEMMPTGTLTFTAHIARGDDFIQTIEATVNPGFTGVLRPKVTVSTVQGISQDATAAITVQRPDYALQLVAEASPSPAPPGGQVTYQVRLTNVGNRPVQPAVEAILPAQVSTAEALTFTPNTLGPGDIWTKSLIGAVDPAAAGELTALFRATSPEGAAALYTVTVPVAAPNLHAAKSGTPAFALAGRTLTYTLALTNAGNVDFTLTITDNPPTDLNGRPLIAPGAPQVWTGVQLPAGAVWRQTVVAVVEPGYSGPLNSSLEATTHTGLSAKAVDGREAMLPVSGPTIRAVRTGNWNDPATWEPSRVPDPADIALVPEGITLDVDGGSNNPIVLAGLINQGSILLHCLEGQPMRLEIADTLENTGLIRADDAEQLGEAGCGVEVQVGTLLNDGIIRSGNGADGGNGIDAGDGGAMLVFGQNIVNNGQIIAGDGGNVPPPAPTGRGGAGGDAIVVAGPPSPALLLNRGLIASGKGGDGPAGGNGGDLALLSLSLISIDGGQTTAGAGGAGQPPGANGVVSLGAAAIWEDGVTRLNGDGFAFSTLAPARVRGISGGTALAPFFFLNRGMNPDTYHFFWSNSSGWPVTALPPSVKVSNLRIGLVLVSMPIPAGLSTGATSTLRLTARSQGQPAHSVERSVEIVVAGGGRLFLPSLLINNSPGSLTGQAEAAPAAAQPLHEKPLPAGSSHLYLPLVGYLPSIGE